MTPNAPGAVAIIQLTGGDVTAVLAELTGVTRWPLGGLRLVSFAGIDDGLAARVTLETAQLMPHGGVRVIQRLAQRLRALGVHMTAETPPPSVLFPEAGTPVETLMLLTLARARSSLAIDLLLDQPRRWRGFEPAGDPELERRSRVLDRLVDPPSVVVVGAPNVGKSTLTNTLAGRTLSVTEDRAGTTRDYTSTAIDLRGLVVRWHDTPGVRTTEDAIEDRALAIAAGLIEQADLLIAMTDETHAWPTLPRAADIRVRGKCDRDDRMPRGVFDVAVSSVSGAGLEQLVTLVRDRLAPPAILASPLPWRFDPRLPTASI